MHTYLAVLLVQESLFKGGVIDPHKNEQNFRTHEDWKAIKKKWEPYIWAFRQVLAFEGKTKRVEMLKPMVSLD